MADAADVLLQHRQRILAGEGEVAGVVAEEYLVRVGAREQAVGLRRGLHDRAHVVMVAQLEAARGRNRAQAVQTRAQAIPLGVVHRVLGAGEHGRVHLPLNGITLLGDVDAVRANGLQKVQLARKVGLDLLDGLRQQERGEPPRRDAHAAQVELALELGGVGRVLVSDLAAGEARQRHLADGLAKGVFAAQLGHVVVAPTNRRDAQKDLVGIKHGNLSFGRARK